MKAVSVRNARSHLKALLDLVAAGEEIVICRRGKVAARLVPPAPKRRRRPDLTAFRNTICLKGEPVSVTGRTHGSRSVLDLRRHERDCGALSLEPHTQAAQDFLRRTPEAVVSDLWIGRSPGTATATETPDQP